MVHQHTVHSIPIVTRAAAKLNLEFVAGDADRWQGHDGQQPEGPQVGLLQIPGGGASLGLSRQTSRIGVFGNGPYTLVWDDYRDGFGLVSRVGYRGRHLAAALTIAEVETFCDNNKLNSSLAVYGDDRLEFSITREGSMTAQPEIIVTIDPKGGVKIEVEGCSGPACESLTKGLEEALGKVTSNERTGDYHKAQTQQIKIGQK